MRVFLVLLTLLVLAALSFPMTAETPAFDQVNQADRLRIGGQPKAAVSLLEPIIQGDGKAISQNALGVAWNVMGSSYEDLRMLNRAAECYQKAMEILRPLATGQVQYAAAMANLASLEDWLGQIDSSRALNEKANHIYEAMGDSAGITVTSTALAMMSYSRKDFKAAHRFLKRALDQAQRARGLREDDVAAMDSVSSALAFHEGNYDEAVACIQRSINLWTHAHGPSAPSLGLGYALRAQALAKTGDYRRAVADAQHALAVIDAAYGRDNTAYLHMQMVYSQILRGAGQKQQASQLQRQASRSLADLSSLQCAGCTINANGFR